MFWSSEEFTPKQQILQSFVGQVSLQSIKQFYILIQHEEKTQWWLSVIWACVAHFGEASHWLCLAPARVLSDQQTVQSLSAV